MATTREQLDGLRRLLDWLFSRIERGLAIDEYSLFIQAATSTPKIRQTVTEALAANNYPPIEQLSRDQYYTLVRIKQHFDPVLEALARALGLTLEELYNLFCVKLKWCSRHRAWSSGWNRLIGRLTDLLPAKYRKRTRDVAAVAPWIWDWISIFIELSKTTQITLFLIKLSAFLAIKGLDRLCGCSA